MIINYGSFTFIIVPQPSPQFGNTFSSHVLLDLKKTIWTIQKVYTVLMRFDEIRSKVSIVLSNSI